MKKVLSVDDEPLQQLVLHEVLKDEIELFCVSSGEECLKIIEKTKPDIIFIGMILSGMNGIQTAEKIRGLTSHKEIPIVFLSTQKPQKYTDCVKKLKSIYLTKPFKKSDLKAVENYYLLNLKHSCKAV